MAREKPLFGDPCNGCGLCCIAGPCGTGSALTGQTEGRCRLLEADGTGGFRCGLLTRPAQPYITEALAVAIAAGLGCDAVDSIADAVARLGRRSSMIEKARAARRAASPEAEVVLRHWGLAPP